MDKSVTNFYGKNAENNYANNYDSEHGPRLDDVIAHFKLKDIKNKSILDVGGGRGFLGKRLDESNQYFVFDGATVEKPLCQGMWVKTDLDRDYFANGFENKFDVAFCLETLEHLTNPYNCLAEIKKMVKIGGDIYLSIPDLGMQHNTIYPGLIYGGFDQFLQQMALEPQGYFLWDKGWPIRNWHCKNRPWEESKMLFPKYEEKFKGKTPIEYTNL